MNWATKLFVGPFVEVLGRGELLDAAVVEDRDPVGHGQRLGLVVGHVDHGDAEALVQVLDLELHVLAQLLVEGAERLVHEDQLGLEDEGPGEGDALLLAAGELRRAAAGEAAHLHHVEGARDLGVDLGLGELADLQREGEVLADGHVREERVVLEHHADAALVGRHRVDRPAGEGDLAVGRGLEAREHHQAGGLARPGGAEHRQELALADMEVEVFDHEGLAVIALLHVLESYEGGVAARICHACVPAGLRAAAIGPALLPGCKHIDGTDANG